MEVQYKSRKGRFFFKLEAATHKELFEGIADLQDIFEADDACGMCGKQNIRFKVRESKKGNQVFKYFELVCGDCGARFDFGQTQAGGSLFPKRRDAEGRNLPNRGWYKWQPQGDNGHE